MWKSWLVTSGVTSPTWRTKYIDVGCMRIKQGIVISVSLFSFRVKKAEPTAQWGIHGQETTGCETIFPQQGPQMWKYGLFLQHTDFIGKFHVQGSDHLELSHSRKKICCEFDFNTTHDSVCGVKLFHFYLLTYKKIHIWINRTGKGDAVCVLNQCAYCTNAYLWYKLHGLCVQYITECFGVTSCN